MNTHFGNFGSYPCQTSWISCQHIDAAHSMRLQIHDFNGTGEFELLFDLNKGVFGVEQGAELVDHFTRLLRALTADNEQPIGQPSLIEPAEFSQEGQFDYRSITEMIREQVDARGKHTALRYQGDTITYAHLESEVAQLSARLNKAGIESGSRVGIYLKRSPELIFGLLSLFRLGASYVPIPRDFHRSGSDRS